MQEFQESLPQTPLSPLLHREAVERAQRWLAAFAPCVVAVEELSAEECRRRVETLAELKEEGTSALQGLRAQATQGDSSLLDTLSSAHAELEHVETALRRRLAALAPGDPEGRVDLEALQTTLAQIAARREVAEAAGEELELSGRLELTTSRPNWGSAGCLGLFALGWLSFTTVHATFMIGGMFMAFGPLALLMLLFYAMFWAAGAAMAVGAYRSACTEEVTIEGDRMHVTRILFGTRSVRAHTLGPDSRASLVEPTMKQSGSDAKDVAITDVTGREVRIASGRPAHEQARIVERVNRYIQTLPALSA